MKYILITFLSLLISTRSIAQKADTTDSWDSVGQWRINLSYTAQYYLNKPNLIDDDKTANPLHPKNTFGYSTGIDLEHISRHGIVINAGIRYETRSHNIDIVYDMTNYDPDALKNLNGVVVMKNEAISTAYISPRIMLGYRKRLNNWWSFTGKAGVSMKFLLNEQYDNDILLRVSRDSKYLQHSYYTDDYSELRKTTLVSYSYPFNRQKYWYFTTPYTEFVMNYQLYFGFEHKVSIKYFSDFSLGIEFTRAVATTSKDYLQDAMQASSSPGYRLWGIGGDYYFDRNISFGLRLAVGLWP